MLANPYNWPVFLVNGLLFCDTYLPILPRMSYNTAYQDTLDYLYSTLPAFQRQGAPALKPGLKKTEDLCWALGLPQWKFKSIHIAGTNGKGSVSAMLFSILRAAGYRVGLYTSPHLLDFTERIRVNEDNISQGTVVEFVEELRPLIEKLHPSFFELTVGMAFNHFADNYVDLAVVETGLGGRLDSTNIIRPELSVITNIDYDHQQLLGDTLGQIASEKAGIIKKYTPVVIGDYHAETAAVFARKAQEMNAPMWVAENQYKISPIDQASDYQSFRIFPLQQQRAPFEVHLDLAGHYQQANLRTVLSAVDSLIGDGWEIPLEAIQKGLSGVRRSSGLRGRMETLGEQPRIICDTGHNKAGVSAVMKQLAQIPHRALHIIWGMVKDKDISDILPLLPQNAHYYWVEAQLPRALEVERLAAQAQAIGLKGQVHLNVATGIQEALKAAAPDDLVFIGGSTFVVAEALERWAVHSGH